eukprot:TRINITY_DN10512_c0_g1_i1.p2 TRINITY_DN10512_c0_g1~~TRINITY_DN10512_c0_g1_i1.p2  ORF type:complete len:103 (-),score=33.17 TRINITY_DN10512_c0_g1_i1:55-363(-)
MIRVRTNSTRNNKTLMHKTFVCTNENSPIKRNLKLLKYKSNKGWKPRVFNSGSGYYARNYSVEVREGMPLKPHNIILSEVIRKSPPKKRGIFISFPILSEEI